MLLIDKISSKIKSTLGYIAHSTTSVTKKDNVTKEDSVTKEEEDAEYKNQSGFLIASKVIMKLLADKHINFEIEEDANDKKPSDILILTFRYQGKMFVIKASRTGNSIRVEYPGILSIANNRKDALMNICNRMNKMSSQAKVIYDTCDGDNRYYIHVILFFGLSGPKEHLNNLLDEAFNTLFQAERTLMYEYNKYMDEIPEPNDPLLEILTDRNLALQLEHEIYVQPKDASYHFNTEEGLSIGKLIYIITEEDEPSNFRELKIITDSIKVIDNANDIYKFNIFEPMIEGKDENATLIRKECEMFVKYQDMYIPIIIKMLLDDNECIYYRLTIYQPDTDTLTFERLDFKADAISITIAYDRSSAHSRKKEFEYLWNDAKDKQKEGKENEMSDEQKKLYRINHIDCATDVYWGNKYYKEKRYLEAILHLETAFKHLQMEYQSGGSTLREIFLAICMKLGYCYSELKMYKKAYFYLEICFEHRQLDSTIEYVNTLVANKDFRATQIIGMLINSIDSAVHKKNAPKDLVSFNKFLLRSKGKALLNQGKIKEALKFFTRMLSDPDNRMCAIKELEFIRQRSGEDLDDHKFTLPF